MYPEDERQWIEWGVRRNHCGDHYHLGHPDPLVTKRRKAWK